MLDLTAPAPLCAVQVIKGWDEVRSLCKWFRLPVLTGTTHTPARSCPS